MNIKNCNGAIMGHIESEAYNRIIFHPKKGWSGYTAYGLEEVAKKMRLLE